MADVGEAPKSKLEAADEAVRLALDSRWQEALVLNDELLTRFGPDADTCNRRGKALLELGRLGDAEAAYRTALELSPGNQIARRQLAKLAELRAGREEVAPVQAAVDIALFTDEPGKTAITNLLPARGVGSRAVAPGDPVQIEVREETVVVRSLRGLELGGIEPRLSQRVAKLSQGGNRYAGAITHVDEAGIQLILRETYQAPELAGTNSFPLRKLREISYRPYAKELAGAREEEPPSRGDDDEEHSGPARDPSGPELEEGFAEVDEAEGEAEVGATDDDDARPEDEY
ncbi:MAG: tetratricopeptide repeat protein [Candidatus Dormibacteria bacterium]